MKVLIACEYSGRVRDAFIRQGHDAYSCDIKDTLSPGPHFKCDVRKLLNNNWDLMIAFPPCTYLANSGNRHWRNTIQEEEALKFVITLWKAPIPKLVIENPPGQINSQICKPDQIIQPYMFGDPYTKRTCLWIENLPPLIPTRIVKPIGPWVNGYAKKSERDLTFNGISEAMSIQWG